MKTLLRGGYVVSGRGCRRADVLIDGEKVEMLGHIPPELAAAQPTAPAKKPSAAELRREQLRQLPGNRKKMRF